VALVISLNDKRRHLTVNQRSLAAARAKELFQEEAKERQRAGLKQFKGEVSLTTAAIVTPPRQCRAALSPMGQGSGFDLLLIDTSHHCETASQVDT
jgi:hypothetical protein